MNPLITVRRGAITWATLPGLLLGLPVTAHAAPGDLDPTFGHNGWAAARPFKYSHGTGVAIQPDGRIVASVAGGSSARIFAVVRFLSDGSLDPSFGEGGWVRTRFPAPASAQDVLLQPDGRIAVLGNSRAWMALARYLSDGSLDPTFSGDGKVRIRFFGKGPSHAYAGALTPTGRIALAGSVGRKYGASNFAVAPLTSSGRMDPRFGGDGRVSVSFDRCRSCSGAALDVAIGPRGTVVVVGQYRRRFAIAGLTHRGQLDRTFRGIGSLATQFGTARNALAQAVTVSASGQIVVAGHIGCCSPTGIVAMFGPRGASSVLGRMASRTFTA